jgi:group I intron endonuclease
VPSGIYVLTSPSGGQYVGSAVNVVDRRGVHLRDLRKGSHHNKPLQNAWRKYNGELKFRILLVCAKEDLIYFEQRAIDVLKPRYNVSPTAGSPLGVRHSPEVRAKISAHFKGRPKSPEHKAKISKSRIGFNYPPEFGAKISAAKRGKPSVQRGRKASPEVIARLVAANIGRPLSPEHRAKLSAIGKGRPHAPEHAAKLRIILARGRQNRGPVSEETRAKISAAGIGRKVSAETRAKVSATLKARYK